MGVSTNNDKTQFILSSSIPMRIRGYSDSLPSTANNNDLFFYDGGAGSSVVLDITSFREVNWGYAEHNGLTGGSAGSLYTVTNTADSGAGSLRDALSASDRLIRFSPAIYGGTILLTSLLTCSVSNISIDAVGANVIFGGRTIRFTGSNYVIAGTKHIYPANSPAPGEGTDPITFRRASGAGSDQLFGVYGCTFDMSANPDGADTCIDVIWKQGQDTRGTVAGCLFQNSKRAMLIHSGETTNEGTSFYETTLAWNRMTKIFERMPFTRDSHVHLYNQLTDRYGGAATAGTPARMGDAVLPPGGFTNGLFAENCVAFPNTAGNFDYKGVTVTSPQTAWFSPSSSNDGTPNMKVTGTHLKANGSTTPTQTQIDAASVFAPPYSGYPLATANDVLYDFIQDVVGHSAGIRTTLTTTPVNPWASFGTLKNGQVISVKIEAGAATVSGIDLIFGATNLGAMANAGSGVWTKTISGLTTSATGDCYASATTSEGIHASPIYPTIVLP